MFNFCEIVISGSSVLVFLLWCNFCNAFEKGEWPKVFNSQLLIQNACFKRFYCQLDKRFANLFNWFIRILETGIEDAILAKVHNHKKLTFYVKKLAKIVFKTKSSKK